MAEEFYTRTIFKVSDVDASVTYYRDRLGFELAWSFPEESPIIAQVGRNGLDLILDSASAIPRASGSSVVAMTLHAPEKLGALYEEYTSKGARTSGVPAEAPWEPGLYQFDVRDPDGNVLVFWGERPGD